MKIYEIGKPLNPEAPEWRPLPPPPPKVLRHHPASFHYYHYCLSHAISFPSHHYSRKAAAAAAPPKNRKPEKADVGKEVAPGVKCPKYPCHDGSKAQKKFVPPRLRRAFRSYNGAKHAAPPLPRRKQEWCKKSENHATSSPPSKQERRRKNDRSDASPTTVMIRNIPNQIRRSFFLKFLDQYCRIYSLEYDLLYLPVDFRKLGNLGYAFVNFTTAAAAKKVMKILSNYKWHSFTTDDGEVIYSGKVVKITWARIQGKEAFIRRFKNSRFICTDPEFLPVVLDPPRNGLDPNPPPPLNLGSICSSI